MPYNLAGALCLQRPAILLGLGGVGGVDHGLRRTTPRRRRAHGLFAQPVVGDLAALPAPAVRRRLRLSRAAIMRCRAARHSSATQRTALALTLMGDG